MFCYLNTFSCDSYAYFCLRIYLIYSLLLPTISYFYNPLLLAILLISTNSLYNIPLSFCNPITSILTTTNYLSFSFNSLIFTFNLYLNYLTSPSKSSLSFLTLNIYSPMFIIFYSYKFIILFSYYDYVVDYCCWFNCVAVVIILPLLCFLDWRMMLLLLLVVDRREFIWMFFYNYAVSLLTSLSYALSFYLYIVILLDYWPYSYFICKFNTDSFSFTYAYFFVILVFSNCNILILSSSYKMYAFIAINCCKWFPYKSFNIVESCANIYIRF